MKQLTGLIVFGLAIALTIPASAQLTGLDGGDTSSTTGRKDVNNINPTRAKTVNVTDNGRDIQIVVGRDGSIEVKVTRKYESERIAELADKYPELAEALGDFPKKLGSHKVDLSIGLSSTVKANSLLALKEKSAAAFAVYKKYHDYDERNNNVADSSNDGGIIGRVNNGSTPRSYSARSKKRNLPKPNVATIASKEGEEGDDLGDLLDDDFDDLEEDEKDNKKNSRKRRDKDDK